MENILEKIVSVFLLITNIIFNFFFNLIGNPLPNEEVIDIHMVANITNPQQVIWKSSNEILFVTDGDIWEYVISKESSSHIGKREPNEFVGVGGDGEILLCSIEHFTISAHDEFSTRFEIRELDTDEKKEMYFFETIRPIYLDSESIVAVTAMDFLEKYFYEIDIEGGKMREIDEPKKRIEGVYVPECMDVRDIYLEESGNYVVEDIFGNIFVAVRRP